MGALFIVMFYPYAIADPLLRAGAYGLAYIAFTTALTAYVVPYLGLMSELTDDYSERTAISVYRNSLGYIGGLSIQVIAWFMVIPAATMAGDAGEGYRNVGFVAAGLGVTLYTEVALNSPRRGVVVLPLTPMQQPEQIEVIAAWRTTAQSPALRRFLEHLAKTRQI